MHCVAWRWGGLHYVGVCLSSDGCVVWGWVPKSRASSMYALMYTLPEHGVLDVECTSPLLDCTYDYCCNSELTIANRSPYPILLFPTQLLLPILSGVQSPKPHRPPKPLPPLVKYITTPPLPHTYLPTTSHPSMQNTSHIQSRAK